MASEGLEDEEWDADFLEELVQAEEQALSTQSPNQPPLPLPPPPPAPISYSPPRELSQRTRDTVNDGGIAHSLNSFAPPGAQFSTELEIDRLKKELGRVSKQLNLMEQECSQLRKERDKKECLKVIHSRVDKDGENCLAMNTDSKLVMVTGITSFPIPHILEYLERARMQIHQITNLAHGQNVAFNTVGVQTDKITELTYRGSEKLLGLWNSSNQKLGQSLVGKLLTTCETDLHVLFGYMNSSSSSKANMRSTKHDPDLALSDQLHSAQPVEAEKVSQFYSQLTKTSNETSRLEDLLEALVDICTVTNAVLVHRSLHVLHMILANSYSMDKRFAKRENVMVEVPFSGSSNPQSNGCEGSEKEVLSFTNLTEMLNEGNIPDQLKLSNVTTPIPGGFFDHHSFSSSISVVYWVSLFERMRQITIINNEKEIKREALSIMNLILMRQNAYLHRDKFVGEHLFQSLSQLLKKDAGFCVQDLAVHTLYLLCNCPKVMAMLCSGHKEVCASSSGMNEKKITTFQGLDEILIGLADCVAFRGSATAEEMKLRRNAVLFLTFLGSSGKLGMEILLSDRLPKGTNFLTIIVQSLTADLELTMLKSVPLSEVVREQNFLIREALILLNRLVSHKEYSVPILQALTNTRDMASMTVDLASRLTYQSKLLWGKRTTNQIRESEIMDLARVFKKRVFTFLGDSIS